MLITVATGTGEGPTPLAAFDAALIAAGVANYNLIYLSSVIPAGSIVQRSKYLGQAKDYGDRVYIVLARRQEHRPGKSAWAGLGWVQEKETGCGLFVELSGATKSKVDEAISVTLESMLAKRCRAFGPIQRELAGIECQGAPVCALVIGVYWSVSWD